MKKTVQLALIGCGAIATNAHIPCYKKLHNVEVVAVADSQRSKAKAVARRFNIEKWYIDYQEMLKNENIDAVDICTPPHVHAEQSIIAAELGIHILCEKPIATRTEDARKTVSAVEKANVKFMVGNVYRFHPLYRKVNEETRNPKLMWITNIFRPHVDKSHWIFDPEKSGGILIEQAVHWFDLFRWFGGELQEVHASSRQSGLRESHMISIKFESGAIGSLLQSTDSSIPLHTFGVIDSQKTMIISGHLLPSKSGGLLQTRDATNRRSIHMLIGRVPHRVPPQFPHLISSILSKIQDSTLVPFYNELVHFINCVQNNSRPEVSSLDGLRCLEIADAAYESAKRGRKVALNH